MSTFDDQVNNGSKNLNMRIYAFHKISYYFMFFLIGLACTSCNDPEQQRQGYISEIKETEAAFAQMAKDTGITKAFLHFAAPEAVLLRNEKIYKGKNDIAQYFQNHTLKNRNVELSWAPLYVDVSSSGDLGYTYGEYQVRFKDQDGKDKQASGIFHTVWKKQADGSWKFVWD